MARRERGVSRILEKLQASVNAGQYYEAHQMYRTIYFRYLNQEKYEELLQLLHSGANVLLDKDQQGSGTDLAILIVDVLTKGHVKPCEEWIEKIAKLFAKINSNVAERETFLINAIKWSMYNNNKGHPLLHKRIAEVYWQEENLTSAHRHFLHSRDGVAYATMLIELQKTKGLKSEIDTFIVQAVLRILCLKDKEMADDAFKEYIKSHPDIVCDQLPSSPYPLLNFIYLLLKVIDEKNAKEFVSIRNHYEEFLKRDANYSNYLDTIGHVWFGISAPGHHRNPHLLSGIIKSMMGEIDSAEEETNNLSNKVNIPDLD